MSTIERFEDLEAWKRARSFAKLIHAVSGTGDFGRDFGLRDQIRRAANSIVSNIAEGFERDGDKEFLQYLFVAKGSCGEVRAQLYLAIDYEYITEQEFSQLKMKALELNRIISGLIKYLKQSHFTGKKYKARSYKT
ncbi:MAG TPA: four helix bundle protein [Pyrinomonadaceae bacterium]|nr:four helix bundle protein [Pyrinomonadaceae bacterium]